MTIKHLVLSSGAYKGFYTIGSLYYLQEQEFYNINDIKSIYGTSVGSIIGAILCLKLDFNDLIEYAINKPWHKSFKLSVDSLLNILSNKGFVDKRFIVGVFENLLKNAGLSKKCKLKDLYEHSGIDLNLFTTKYEDLTLLKISHKSHPDMELIDAIYISSTIPFIFQPLYIENNCFIDGAVLNPYPLDDCIFDLKEKYGDISKNEILGLKILDGNLKPGDKSSSIFYFGFYMLNNLIDKTREICKEEIPYELVIPTSDVLSLESAKNVIYNKEERKRLIEIGKNYAKVFLSTITKQH